MLEHKPKCYVCGLYREAVKEGIGHRYYRRRWVPVCEDCAEKCQRTREIGTGRKRSPGGREENSWGGKRQGAGRPKSEEKVAGVTVSAYLSADDAAYLAQWGKGNSAALRELIDRARRFWPQGV